MNRCVLLLSCAFLVAAGCGDGTKQPPSTPSAHNALSLDAYLEAVFGQGMATCEKDADCISGVCERDSYLAIGTDTGLCLGLPGAYMRWQRTLLAEGVAEGLKAHPEWAEPFLIEVQKRYDSGLPDGEKEAFLLMARAVGNVDANAWLAQCFDEMPEGGLKTFTAVLLAHAGDLRGRDLIADAALSSVVRTRLLGIDGGAAMCDELGHGILAEGLTDAHPLIRRRSAQGLARCHTKQGKKLLEERLHALQQNDYPPDGEIFPLESALSKW